MVSVEITREMILVIIDALHNEHVTEDQVLIRESLQEILEEWDSVKEQEAE